MNCADVLLYYSEAFLPFLKTYYTEFYQTDQCILEGETTNNIYAALLVRICVMPMLL